MPTDVPAVADYGPLTHGRRVSDLGQHQWDVPALRHLMDKVLPENKPFENFEIEDP